jgi:hypothetical protein
MARTGGEQALTTPLAGAISTPLSGPISMKITSEARDSVKRAYGLSLLITAAMGVLMAASVAALLHVKFAQAFCSWIGLYPSAEMLALLMLLASPGLILFIFVRWVTGLERFEGHD